MRIGDSLNIFSNDNLEIKFIYLILYLKSCYVAFYVHEFSSHTGLSRVRFRGVTSRGDNTFVLGVLSRYTLALLGCYV